MGTVFAKIRGARSVGVLLTPADVFVVYDLGNSLMKWEYKSEMRTKALMKRCCAGSACRTSIRPKRYRDFCWQTVWSKPMTFSKRTRDGSIYP